MLWYLPAGLIVKLTFSYGNFSVQTVESQDKRGTHWFHGKDNSLVGGKGRWETRGEFISIKSKFYKILELMIDTQKSSVTFCKGTTLIISIIWTSNRS